jgi:DNA repair protein RAD7
VDENKENESDPGDEAPEERKKRKRKEEKALLKIKESKEFKKRKFEEKRKNRRAGSDDDEDGDYDDDAIARKMLYKKAQPRPGQFENCEICEKRFTVTPYSKTGPDGGLLCTKCSKDFVKEEKKQQPKKREPQKGRRRQTESDRMMGDVKPGAKTLLEICVRKVAANIVDIEEFGDLPQTLLDRLSQVLSQKRALDPRTLEFFLQADSTKIAIYDAAKLETDDFEKIFSFMPELEDVNLRNAGQMKDEVILYMLDHNPKIKHLQLGAANLITNSGWLQLFNKQGPKLESFKTSDLDAAMDDTAIDSLVHHSPNLRRLKLKKCWRTTESSLLSLTNLPNLQHLSLSICPDTLPPTLSRLLTTLGPTLQTLSLESFHSATDSTLSTIHTSCASLTKLRFTDNSLCTDAGFSALFSHWSNPPIPFLDLADNRDIDNLNPDGAADEGSPIGLASAGFTALMSHSGPALRSLNIKACRHISHDALLHVFDPTNTDKTYPDLRDMDLSFVAQVDEVVMTAIFKTCPRLEKLAVFGCNRVKAGGVGPIPGGVAVIGLMDARESVVVEGGWGGASGMEHER